MDDQTNPDDMSPVEPEVLGDETAQVPVADAADAPVDDTVAADGEPVDEQMADPAAQAVPADPAARSARRKLWTVAAAAAAVGAIGGVAVGAVGAEVLDEGHHDGRDDSAQGWEHGRGGPGFGDPRGGRQGEHRGGDQDDWGGDDWGGRGGDQQGGQPGTQGGNWGPGGGQSRSGGS